MERLYQGQPLVPLGFETLTVSTSSAIQVIDQAIARAQAALAEIE